LLFLQPNRERIDELHALSVRLKKEQLDLTQARLGFTFFQRLLDLHIGPDKLKEWADFCSKISPAPPDGFIPAAVELFHIEKAMGKSYGEIVSEVKEMLSQKETLAKEVENLKADETKAKELRAEVEKNQGQVEKLTAERNKLESAVGSLGSFLQQRAEKLGISPDELEARFKELVSLEAELGSKRSEKNRLEGEIEALTARIKKLSSRMEKASADFSKDIELIREMRDELTQIAEMKGRYEKELEDMEWAKQILPFLRYPDKVDDSDFNLASCVVNCIDKWLPAQNLDFAWGLKWGDITRYVKSKRAQLRRTPQ